MPDARPEEKLEGCLLQADLQFPKKAVFLCGVKDCPVRSDAVGDQGVRCQRG